VYPFLSLCSAGQCLSCQEYKCFAWATSTGCRLDNNKEELVFEPDKILYFKKRAIPQYAMDFLQNFILIRPPIAKFW